MIVAWGRQLPMTDMRTVLILEWPAILWLQPLAYNASLRCPSRHYLRYLALAPILALQAAAVDRGVVLNVQMANLMTEVRVNTAAPQRAVQDRYDTAKGCMLP